jgi:hypothetical protein
MTINKAHEHPFGATVIPHNGTLAGPTPPKPPATVAGAPIVRDLKGEPKQPSKIATKIDELIDLFADRVADKVLARLDGLAEKYNPGVTAMAQELIARHADVEDLNREMFSVGERVPNVRDVAFKPSREPVVVAHDEDQAPRDYGLGILEQNAYTTISLPSESGDANQMHTALEQALRERELVKVTRFAPGPLAFDIILEGITTDENGLPAVPVRHCTVYAQPYGQGYTDGAKPNEYVLLCNGRRVMRSRTISGHGPQQFQGGHGFRGFESDASGVHNYVFAGRHDDTGYSAGLTFDEVLAAVDGPLKSASWGRDS